MGRSGEEYSGQREQKIQSPGKGTSLGSPRSRKNPQNPMQNQGSVGGGGSGERRQLRADLSRYIKKH